MLSKATVFNLSHQFLSKSETNRQYLQDIMTALAELEGIYYDGCLAKRAEMLILVIRLRNSLTTAHSTSVGDDEGWMVEDVWISPYEKAVEHHKRVLLRGLGQLYLSEDLRGMILGSIELQTLVESGQCIQKSFGDHGHIIEYNYFLSLSDCRRMLSLAL
jgi:hypothetical protein